MVLTNNDHIAGVRNAPNGPDTRICPHARLTADYGAAGRKSGHFGFCIGPDSPRIREANVFITRLCKLGQETLPGAVMVGGVLNGAELGAVLLGASEL